ncbi:hypothetical protein LTR28_010197, partial [Elasticomyces elasticus]
CTRTASAASASASAPSARRRTGPRPVRICSRAVSSSWRTRVTLLIGGGRGRAGGMRGG